MNKLPQSMTVASSHECGLEWVKIQLKLAIPILYRTTKNNAPTKLLVPSVRKLIYNYKTYLLGL